MDRLIALIGLRFKLALRAYLRARESLFGLMLALPVMALLFTALAIGAFLVVRGMARHSPEVIAPVLSALGTVFILSWALSPLFTGAAIAEGHDLTRLAQFPASSSCLLGSALIAHIFEPTVWGFAPTSLAIAAALSYNIAGVLPSLIGVGLTLLLMLIAAQWVALAYEWVARRRKWHDRMLLVGFAGGVALSLAPIWLLVGGMRVVTALIRIVIASDPFVVSPFTWGLRAAVHGGRGEIVPFLAFGSLALLACAVGFAGSMGLLALADRSERVLGTTSSGQGAERLAKFLPGEMGAIVSKDLRLIWRDPGLKAALLMGILAPLVLFFWLSRTAESVSATGPLLFLSVLVGLAPLGMNVFGLERRGIQLLMTFPAPRWKILVGKNAAGLVMRTPGLVLLLGASLLMASTLVATAALTSAAILLLLAAAAENYLSILFPITLPAPGRSPHVKPAGGRGLGIFFVTSMTAGLVLIIASPFMLLAWLPLLLDLPWIALFFLPLALAGAAATCTLLVGGAARLLSRRETALLERILGEA